MSVVGTPRSTLVHGLQGGQADGRFHRVSAAQRGCLVVWLAVTLDSGVMVNEQRVLRLVTSECRPPPTLMVP